MEAEVVMELETLKLIWLKVSLDGGRSGDGDADAGDG
jgi:hypothetical protein